MCANKLETCLTHIFGGKISYTRTSYVQAKKTMKEIFSYMSHVHSKKGTRRTSSSGSKSSEKSIKLSLSCLHRKFAAFSVDSIKNDSEG